LIPLIKEIQFQFHEESDSQETLMTVRRQDFDIASPNHFTSSLLRARKQHCKKSNALFT